MTKKQTAKPRAVSDPFSLSAWAIKTEKERIKLDPHNIPHINSTMSTPYRGTELNYRGVPCR